MSSDTLAVVRGNSDYGGEEFAKGAGEVVPGVRYVGEGRAAKMVVRRMVRDHSVD
jgi:hypothetical protein